MKAVVYHADSHWAWGGPVNDAYRKLFTQFRAQCHEYGMQLVHLTLEGFPGEGDENYYYAGLDNKHIVANREECFYRFMQGAGDDVYWFTEPDCRILKMWPPLKGDAALLYRFGDSVPMCPAWRLATKKALPLFEEWAEGMKAEPLKDWHGDSELFKKAWMRYGSPKVGEIEYRGLKIEMRPYEHYVKGNPVYTRNFLSKQKFTL